MASIAEELAKLTNPNPSFDPEDNNVDDTAAKLVDKHNLDIPQDENTQLRRTTLRIEIEDAKYEGEVVSRKALDDSDFHSSENEFEISDELSEQSENDLHEDNDDEDNMKEFMDDEEIDSDEAMGSSDEEKFAPGIFSKKPAKPVHKSADTKNQIQLWEKLLETRIRVQKLLMFANQLPQNDSYQNCMDEEELNPLLKSTSNAQENLLTSLFNLQSKLLEQNKETKDMLTNSEEPEDDDWNTRIDKRQTILRTHRNKILAHWYDKTRMGSGKINKKQSFTNFERPTIETIEHVLKDQSRLIQRTRIKRSEYKVLGKTTASESREENEEATHNAHLKKGDGETFDDDDFYQHLLRQFIEQKSSTITTNASNDSIEMTRQWLKHQRLKPKVKKNVDTKASKGRKIRYHIHPKLISFMAPSTESTWTDESIDQLVKSMFGKNLS